MNDPLARILAHTDRHDPGRVVGIYLYGSAVLGGPQKDSDLDILAVTQTSLTQDERVRLSELLLDLSGWNGHSERFPEATGRRPLEMTVLTLPDLVPLTTDPRRDYQYGEWLREDLLAGAILEPQRDPDCIVLLATALQESIPLRGAPLREVVEPVPFSLLRGAIVGQVPTLLSESDGDERNVLLTLARMLVTLETRRIVSKDAAARIIATRLEGNERELLELARAGYLGLVRDSWDEHSTGARAVANALANQVLSHSTRDPLDTIAGIR